MKAVKDSGNEFQAMLAAGMLEEDGLHAVVFNKASNRELSVVVTRPGARPYIMVPDGEYERAVELLARDEDPNGRFLECEDYDAS